MGTRKCCGTPEGAASPHTPYCVHANPDQARFNWDFTCTLCGRSPVVVGIGLCESCCFGTSETNQPTAQHGDAK